MKLIKFIMGIEQKVKDCSDEELAQLYDKNWTISFDGKAINIPFDAVSYNAITEALKEINNQK